MRPVPTTTLTDARAFLLYVRPIREVLGLDDPQFDLEIQNALLDYLKGREDIVLHGAHALNAHISVNRKRTTIDTDLIARHNRRVGEELLIFLREKFPQLTLRASTLLDGRLYRIWRVQKPEDTSLVDVWRDYYLADSAWMNGVRVLTAPGIAARKVMSSCSSHREKRRRIQDWADIEELLAAHPELKRCGGEVDAALKHLNASREHFERWQAIVNDEPIAI